MYISQESQVEQYHIILCYLLWWRFDDIFTYARSKVRGLLFSRRGPGASTGSEATPSSREWVPSWGQTIRLRLLRLLYCVTKASVASALARRKVTGMREIHTSTTLHWYNRSHYGRILNCADSAISHSLTRACLHFPATFVWRNLPCDWQFHHCKHTILTLTTQQVQNQPPLKQDINSRWIGHSCGAVALANFAPCVASSWVAVVRWEMWARVSLTCDRRWLIVTGRRGLYAPRASLRECRDLGDKNYVSRRVSDSWSAHAGYTIVYTSSCINHINTQIGQEFHTRAITGSSAN